MVRQAHHPEPSRRANLNEPNSKFQTGDPPEFVPDGIITGGQRLVQRYGTTAVHVLVIGYCNLRFICNLELGIWDFNIL